MPNFYTPPDAILKEWAAKPIDKVSKKVLDELLTMAYTEIKEWEKFERILTAEWLRRGSKK